MDPAVQAEVSAAFSGALEFMHLYWAPEAPDADV
jgi:hypothetical protein